MTDCVFCRIAAGEIPADIVAGDDEFVAFKDLHPVAPEHVLVIPRRHVASLDRIGDLGEPAAGRLLAFVASVAEKAGVTDGGYRVIVNTGRNAGQEVQHVHVHILGGEPLGPMRCTWGSGS